MQIEALADSAARWRTIMHISSAEYRELHSAHAESQAQSLRLLHRTAVACTLLPHAAAVLAGLNGSWCCCCQIVEG